VARHSGGHGEGKLSGGYIFIRRSQYVHFCGLILLTGKWSIPVLTAFSVAFLIA